MSRWRKSSPPPLLLLVLFVVLPALNTFRMHRDLKLAAETKESNNFDIPVIPNISVVSDITNPISQSDLVTDNANTRNNKFDEIIDSSKQSYHSAQDAAAGQNQIEEEIEYEEDEYEESEYESDEDNALPGEVIMKRKIVVKTNFTTNPLPIATNFSTQEGGSQTSTRFAYAFLLGGVDPQRKSYLGMLYNILIATHVLRESGSKMDVVVFCQMSSQTKRDVIPNKQLKWLQSMGIKVRYLPKPEIQNFHQIIMKKFVILELIEYERVLFLDADVMP